MVVFQRYQRLLAVVVLLFMGQKVRRVGLFLDQVAAVFFIFQDLCHGGRRPKAVALAAEDTGLPQFPRDGAAPFALLQVLMEDEPDNFCTLRVDGHFTADHVIPQQRAAKNDALLHAAHLSPFGAFRGLATLILRDGTHDCQSKLPIVGAGIQAVIEKQHAYAPPTQVTGDLQGVHRVAGETADLLGHDQVDLPQLRRVEHFIELHALVGRCAGKSFVSIDALQLPIRLALDVLAEIPLLRFKGICLVFLIRGYTAIRCYL